MCTEHFLCEGQSVKFFTFIWLLNLYHNPLRNVQISTTFEYL